MSENPFQPPQADIPPVRGVLSGTHDDLRKVAVYQKGLLFCILINILTVLSTYFAPPEFLVLAQIGLLAVGLVGTVFIFMLAIKVYGTAIGIVLGIMGFIPCIGLLVLLAVNGKATLVLKENGIRVGLMGAKLSQFQT